MLLCFKHIYIFFVERKQRNFSAWYCKYKKQQWRQKDNQYSDTLRIGCQENEGQFVEQKMADRMTLQVKDILVTNSTLRRKAALKTDFWPPDYLRQSYRYWATIKTAGSLKDLQAGEYRHSQYYL